MEKLKNCAIFSVITLTFVAAMALSACASYVVPDGSITTAKLASGAVTAANIASSTITGTQMASSVNLSGKTVQENGNNVLVSNTNATNSLAVIAATVRYSSAPSTVSIDTGEGLSASFDGSITFTLTWSTAFSSTPTVIIGGLDESGGIGNYARVITSVSTTGATIKFNTNPAVGVGFTVLAVGQRQ